MTRVETETPAPPIEHTSVLLRQIVSELHGTDVSVGHLVLQLRRRSFGGILMLLAALALLPGISLFAGIAMFIPAFQMAAGMRAPLLPRIVRRRRVSIRALRALSDKALPILEKIERFIRPRWLPLSLPAVQVLVGGLTGGLALLLMLPLPLSNFPPALALGCLALGILERDGVFIALGLVLSALALALGIFMGMTALEAISIMIDRHLG